ncbi:MAG TPA: methyltransferase domain-containing protein [Desulfosarcina sp.]|nr:methyltransferase domain-containing protein [Desulfosarcina sp.]
MPAKRIEFGSRDWDRFMGKIYGENMSRFVDIIGRKDFFGVIGERGFEFLCGRLNLSDECHVLDLGCGIGGPARFLARRYGCRVTGVDVSAANIALAEVKTKQAGLSDRVRFVHGNATDVTLPAEGYTHVIGCDAWLYFEDKPSLYALAHRLLEKNGAIAFLESTREKPADFYFETVIGKCHMESVERHVAMLREARFESIETHDVSAQSLADILFVLKKVVQKREEIIEALGSDYHHGLLAVWVDYLTAGTSGLAKHLCFTARKT